MTTSTSSPFDPMFARGVPPGTPQPPPVPIREPNPFENPDAPVREPDPEEPQQI